MDMTRAEQIKSQDAGLNRELTQDQKFEILRAYLRQFFVPVSADQLKEMRGTFGRKPGSFLVFGSTPYLLRAGYYFLLADGKKEYACVTSFELLDLMFGKTEEGEVKRSFSDSRTPYLFIYNQKFQAPNKLKEDVILQVVTQREMLGLVTVVLSEEDMKKVGDTMFGIGIKIAREGSGQVKLVTTGASSARMKPVKSTGGRGVKEVDVVESGSGVDFLSEP